MGKLETDDYGVVLGVNERALEMLAVKKEEIIGKNISQILHGIIIIFIFIFIAIYSFIIFLSFPFRSILYQNKYLEIPNASKNNKLKIIGKKNKIKNRRSWE